MPNTRAVCRVCVLIVAVNFLLFGVKLYIGLATNAISIYSDAVNNLFDALSALITFAVLRLMLKSADKNASGILLKSEQLFSFLISIIVTFTGLYFAYSALERFMYPTPVWYTPLYLAVLIVTMAVKLGLAAFLRVKNRALGSPVLRMIAFDSLLDSCITGFTVLTLLLSGAGHFSFDALFGLIISGFITVPAVRMLRSSGASLINYVPAEKRERVNAVLDGSAAAESLTGVQYLRTGDITECCAFFSAPVPDEASLRKRVREETGINLYCIYKEGE